MLPPGPPKLSGRDFDPAAAPDEDVDMENTNEGDEDGSSVELSSIEINILIYLYLLESNFTHTAFTLLSESSLPSTSLFQHFHPSYPTPSTSTAGTSGGGSGGGGRGKPNGTATTPGAAGPSGSGKNASPVSATFGRLDGRIARGELVRKLWKGLRWEEVERHVSRNGDRFKPQCPNPFRLLIPHVCPAGYRSASQNPPVPLPSTLRISPPPRRSEAFPPPAGEAGPSRNRDKPASSASSARANGTAEKDKEKEKDKEGRKERSRDNDLLRPGGRAGRRNSTESGSRAESPAPSQASGRSRQEGKDAAKSSKADGGKEKEKGSDKSERRRDRAKDAEAAGDKKRARMSDAADTAQDERSERRSVKKKDEAEDEDMDKAERRSRRGEAANGGERLATKIKISRAGGTNNDSVSASASASASRSGDASGDDTPMDKRKKRKREEAKEESTDPKAAASASPPAKTQHSNPLWIDDSRIARFNDHRESITSVAWNPKNPNICATSSTDGTARIWEFDEPPNGEGAVTLSKSAKKPLVIKHTSIESSSRGVTSLSWHPEGSVFATSSMDGVGRLFMPNGQLQGIMSFGRRAMNAVKFSPNGQSILTAKDDFTVSLWRIGKTYAQHMAMNYDAHTKEVNDVDWLDEQVFASAGNDHMIFIHRTSDKRVRYALKGHTDDVSRIVWSPPSSTPNAPATDRLLASVADDGYLMIWKMPRYPPERGGSLGSRSASPTKTPAPAPGGGGGGGGGGGEGEGKDESDDYFEAQKAKGVDGIEYCVARFCIFESGRDNPRMDRVQWSPACRDGRMLVAAAAQDTTVKIFDVLSRQLLHQFADPALGVSCFAFSPLNIPGCPLGAIVATGWTGHALIWDVESGEKRAEYEVPDEGLKMTPAAQSIAWREDGKQIALGLQSKPLVIIATPDLRSKAGTSAEGEDK